MANSKISALTAATTPLDGTEVLPIVQSGSTKKVANNDLRPKQIQSNATSGVLQIVGPAAAATRVMTVPNANFTAARTDAAQTFTGAQTFSSDLSVSGLTVGAGGGASNTNVAFGASALTANTTGASNVAVGTNAMQANIAGSQNVGVGRFALLANKTDDNTAVGFGALYSVVTGNQNSAFGSGALFNATGIQNTSVGVNAGFNLTTGSNCGFFGYNVQPSSATVSNEYNYGNSAVGSHRFYGNLTILSATAGVNFTANTGAAGKTSQLLNWYEEGTWTPTLQGGTTAGSYTLNNVSAYYTRIGRQVIINARFDVTVNSAGTGTAKFGGLPFTKSASQFVTGSLITSSVTYAANIIDLSVQGWTSGASTEFAIAGTRSGTTPSDLDVTGIVTGSIFYMTFTYFV